jgi:HK97 family phage major capsid protein
MKTKEQIQKEMKSITDELEILEKRENKSEEDNQRIDFLVKEFNELKNMPVNMPYGIRTLGNEVTGGPIRAFNINQKEEFRQAIRDYGKSNIDKPEELRFGRAIKSLVTGEDCPERRAMGATGSGNWLIQDELAATIIPEILAESKVVLAGALSVPIGQATQTIAKVLTGPDKQWKAENEEYTGGEDITFTGITLTPKTLMTIVTCSVELAEDGLDMERNIEAILREALANEVDRVALEGGLANEPTGIVNTSDVLSEEYDSTYNCFSNAFYKIADENITATGLIIPSSMMKTLDQLREGGETGAYLAPPSSWKEYAKYTSNQIKQAVMGRFSDLLIGARTQMTVEVSRVAGDRFKKLQVGIRAYLRIDTAVRYPESFCVINEVSS